MATLAGLRTLVYAYLGTTANDPAYPPATVNALINAAGNNLVADIHQANPDYLGGATTLLPVTYPDYDLPPEFAGWTDVRLGSPTGRKLTECRSEELADACVPSFAVSYPDGQAFLTVSANVPSDSQLSLLYRYQPAELTDDTDIPVWLSAAFHDLLARKAAIDAFGLGNESAPSALFVESTRDREAQLWVAVGRRGVAPTMQR
jgi:hypothetical protein